MYPGRREGEGQETRHLPTTTVGSTLVMPGVWLVLHGFSRQYLLAPSLISAPPCAVTRGLADGWRGWTVAMKSGVQWAELAGHDYVLDLVSDLELLGDFPRQKSYFIVGAEGPVAGRGGPRA